MLLKIFSNFMGYQFEVDMVFRQIRKKTLAIKCYDH